MDTIPIASRAAATNRQNSVMIFDRADVDLPFIVFHRDRTLNPQIAQINTDSLALLRPVTRAADLNVSRTGNEMIVDHADCLHEGVADRGADEFESTAQQVATHRVGFGSTRRYVSERVPTILDRFAVNETPDICVEASEFFFDVEEPFSVPDCSCDF